ncbi:MAG: FAD-dependent oxidoreductase [Gammaproteobacteria bacterium]
MTDANEIAQAMTPPSCGQDDGLSRAKREAIESLAFGQYVAAHLIVDRAAEDLWRIKGETPLPVLSDGALGVIYGTQGEGNPDARTDVFSLLVHGPAARRLHMKPHDEAVAEMTAALSKLWPGFKSHVRETYFYSHHPAAVAVWPPPAARRSMQKRRRCSNPRTAFISPATGW